MLVYSNYLTLDGAESYKGVFSAISGWVQRKTGGKISSSELKGNNSFDFDGTWVITNKADGSEPYLYSIVIKHIDEFVKGRQWIVEVGVQVNENSTNVSCVLKTDEISSLVSNEVSATRPLLIKYIMNNETLSPNTIGLVVKSLDGSKYSYNAFLYDIQRQDRDYPIVLISPTREGEFLVDSKWLQEQLIGLAQVVIVPRDFNSYEMEDILGKNLSAWDGAVNVIYIPFANGRVHNKLLRSTTLESVGSDSKARISYLLALITHNTNIPNIRKQIRPERVKAKSLKERYIYLKDSKIENTKEYQNNIEELLNMAASQEEQFSTQIEKIELEKLFIEEERDKLQEELASLNWKVKTLQHQLGQSGSGYQNIDMSQIVGYFCRTDDLSPEECLNIIQQCFSSNCLILDNAFYSAQKADSFRQSRRLLDMLRRLIEEYLPQYIKGGDNLARAVFTNNEYSANESETVTSSSKLSQHRTFDYNGRKVEMWQHLRVGVADNLEKTIRVHFHIDKAENLVVIGHCGEHLPL